MKRGNSGEASVAKKRLSTTMNSVEEDTQGGSVEWLRPANVAETFFEACQRHGLLNTAYWLTLSSAKPLKEEDVRLALLHLYRKVRPLRLCFRVQKDGCLWACEKKEDNIDFKVIENGDPREVMEDGLNKIYDAHDGPLWCARLVRGSPEEESPIPELRSSFPYTSHLILGNHHGIADGTSNCQTYNLFLQLLEDLIAGRPVDDEKDFGFWADEAELMQMVEDRKAELKADPERKDLLLAEVKADMENVPLLLQCRNPVQGSSKRTRVLVEVLDEETTRRFLQRCKKEGASVESAITAIINGTTVDLAQKSGVTRDSYRLTESHAVNLRRYLTGNAVESLGVFMTVFSNVVETPVTWKTSFWEYVRTLHRSLHAKIKENMPLHEECLRQLVMPNETLEELLSNLPAPFNDCTTSNMGNIDPKIPFRGDHVQLAQVVRGSANFIDFMVHFYHTFRGRFCYCCGYGANTVTEDSAKEFMQQLFTNLRGVI